MERSKVFIASLIRDREWILEDFLDHIKALDYPKELITIYLLNHESKDKSTEITKKFKRDNASDYEAIIVEDAPNYNSPPNKRRGDYRRVLYQTLSDLRNITVEKFMESDCEYFYAIDCDILIEPNSLNELIKLQKDNNYLMSAAIIYNDYDKGVHGNVMLKKPDSKSFMHINLQKNKNDVIECELSGACWLVNREIFKNKEFRYEYHGQGEDVGLCTKLYHSGLKILSKRNLAKHYMRLKDKLA